MADLRDREVAVSDKNDSRMGPSGRKARSANSFFLLVGGSQDTYNVTVNFDSKNGHWCETLAGSRCHGNGNGKGQKYGPPQQRDKRDPQQWCKHVQAALGDAEKLAEAQERTAIAFGERTAQVVIKPAVPAFPEAKPEPVKSAADRLAEIDAEKAALEAEIAAEDSAALTEALRPLMEKYGYTAVVERAAKLIN